MYRPMPEGLWLRTELPRWLRMAIADALILFGRLEQQTIEISWLLSDAALKTKLELARNPATDNFLAVLEFVELREPDLKLDALKSGFTTLAQERNLIVHGAWTMAGETPWVVWHKFLEDDDSIVGEFFGRRRFERLRVTGEHVLGMLRQFHDMLEKQIGKRTSAVPRA
jgi:hypothetical protein